MALESCLNNFNIFKKKLIEEYGDIDFKVEQALQNIIHIINLIISTKQKDIYAETKSLFINELEKNYYYINSYLDDIDRRENKLKK